MACVLSPDATAALAPVRTVANWLVAIDVVVPDELVGARGSSAGGAVMEMPRQLEPPRCVEAVLLVTQATEPVRRDGGLLGRVCQIGVPNHLLLVIGLRCERAGGVIDQLKVPLYCGIREVMSGGIALNIWSAADIITCTGPSPTLTWSPEVGSVPGVPGVCYADRRRRRWVDRAGGCALVLDCFEQLIEASGGPRRCRRSRRSGNRHRCR